MAFVNISLLAGALLIAVPILLHLLMKQRPQPYVFPALRLLKLRQLANQRRLQLRHLLLLVLRCAAIVLAALALARPSVASSSMSNWIFASILLVGALLAGALAATSLVRSLARWITIALASLAAIALLASFTVGARALAGGEAVLGDEETPVAAVLLIDNSPRMELKSQNQTRLTVAGDLAQWLIEQLPDDSAVAVMDLRAGSGAFAVDRAAASDAALRLKSSGNVTSLSSALSRAVKLAKSSKLLRKEIYVVTDLAKTAWNPAETSEIEQLLAYNSDVQLYVVDVGVERPQNIALGDLQLEAEQLPLAGQLALETTISSAALTGDRAVNLKLEESDPTLPVIRDGKLITPPSVLRSTRQVTLADGTSETLRFVVGGLSPGVHQGIIEIASADALTVDDRRYFAIEVRDAAAVLVVAPRGVSTTYITEAIAPTPLRETGQARFRTEVISPTELASKELALYQAVALVDPTPLAPEAWQQLTDYVAQGGGLAVFLGPGADPTKFQQPLVTSLLGGKLSRQTRAPAGVYLAPESYDHPILAPLRQLEASVPWQRFPVFFHWNLDDLQPAARALIPYGNGKPCLVEHRLGRGSVMTMTTPISGSIAPGSPPLWNELATGEDAWPCFVLVNEMMLHLAGTGQSQLNVMCGEAAVLDCDPAEYPDRYQLFTPLDQPQEVRAREDRLVVRFTDQPGNYRLRGTKSGPMVRGFAVNLPSAMTDLTRFTGDELDDLLGKDRFHFARNRDEIRRVVGTDRIGSEFYPLLVGALVIAFALEQLLTSRFYRGEVV